MGHENRTFDFNIEVDDKQILLFTIKYKGDGTRDLIMPDGWVDPAELDLD